MKAKKRIVDGEIGLADVNGQLCVTCCIADTHRPVLKRVYWPARCLTRDLMACFDYADVTLEDLTVEKSLPGLYKVRRSLDTCWPVRYDVPLRDGARTEPIKVDEIEYAKPPRAREAKYEYGVWYVRREGRMVRADPIAR